MHHDLLGLQIGSPNEGTLVANILHIQLEWNFNLFDNVIELNGGYGIELYLASQVSILWINCECASTLIMSDKVRQRGQVPSWSVPTVIVDLE